MLCLVLKKNYNVFTVNEYELTILKTDITNPKAKGIQVVTLN